MKHPALVLSKVFPALLDLDKATHEADLPLATKELVHLRASQINGCSTCVEHHALELRKAGESDERIISVAAWRHTTYYTEAERAALAFAEAVTRLADREIAVSDAIWDEVSRHYDETALSALIVQIGLINAVNRMNASVQQVAGAWPKA
jgi:AhpD family alkylhydroperoxidase